MSMIERSDDRTYEEFLQQVMALVRQSQVLFKALGFLNQAVSGVPYWLSHFLFSISVKPSHIFGFADRGRVAAGVESGLAKVRRS
jgi:alpha-D-ribose 1-methylphosphonate 5-triphosphate diphosphatase PhnM